MAHLARVLFCARVWPHRPASCLSASQTRALFHDLTAGFSNLPACLSDKTLPYLPA